MLSSRNTLLVVLLIATLSTLPWIGLGEFYTKGEPREASVAVSMIEDGNWVLPYVYADEVAYKPPLTHWMIALCSLPCGEVTPFTSRLPSTIAFIIMVGCCFVFFCKFMKNEEAFVTVLLFMSCFEIHRSAMTARVDMVLTASMVCGLVSLYYWAENKQLKGLPWYIPLLLGLAALTKGPVGIVLPLLIFGVYLLLVRQKLITIILKCSLVAILSLVPLFIWYYMAYLQQGQSFIDLVWAENFGRFVGNDNLNIHYSLGHENPFWINFVYLLSGFLPWTVFILFSLFALTYRFKLSQQPKQLWNKLLTMERGKLFSLIAACLIVFFYCIPMSKRSVYLMPAYPFITVFLGQYMYSVALKHTKVNKAFAIFMGSVVGVFFVLSTSILFGIIDLQQIVSLFSHREKTLFHTSLINEGLSTPTLLYVTLLIALFVSLCALIYQFRKKSRIGILYTTIGIWIMANVLLDGVALPAFKNGTSVKVFANEMMDNYPLEKGNMYVVNKRRNYINTYGLNFYLKNRFLNFDEEQPRDGFFFTTAAGMNIIREEYKEYQFELLEQTSNRFNDTGDVIQLYRFNKVSEN